MQSRCFLLLVVLLWTCVHTVQPFKTGSDLLEEMKAARPRWFIYTPWKIEQWYFQFRDALIHTFGLLDVPVTFVNRHAGLKDLTSSDILLYLGNPTITAFLDEVMKRIEGKGVMVIMYETEPLDSLDRTVPISILKPSLAWTYSMLNVDRIEANYSLPTLYVPPAYSKVVNYGLGADLPEYPTKIEGVDRDKAVATISRGKFKDRSAWMEPYHIHFENVVSAWTHQDWATQVASHHVLINVHKPGRTGLELFRLFAVLSSGMRVVSERSHPEDEKLFEGLVHFVEREEMAQKVQEFLEEGKDAARRERVRKEISHQYHERFSLVNVLARAIKMSEHVWSMTDRS